MLSELCVAFWDHADHRSEYIISKVLQAVLRSGFVGTEPFAPTETAAHTLWFQLLRAASKFKLRNTQLLQTLVALYLARHGGAVTSFFPQTQSARTRLAELAFLSSRVVTVLKKGATVQTANNRTAHQQPPKTSNEEVASDLVDRLSAFCLSALEGHTEMLAAARGRSVGDNQHTVEFCGSVLQGFASLMAIANPTDHKANFARKARMGSGTVVHQRWANSFRQLAEGLDFRRGGAPVWSSGNPAPEDQTGAPGSTTSSVTPLEGAVKLLSAFGSTGFTCDRAFLSGVCAFIVAEARATSSPSGPSVLSSPLSFLDVNDCIRSLNWINWRDGPLLELCVDSLSNWRATDKRPVPRRKASTLIMALAQLRGEDVGGRGRPEQGPNKVLSLVSNTLVLDYLSGCHFERVDDDHPTVAYALAMLGLEEDILKLFARGDEQGALSRDDFLDPELSEVELVRRVRCVSGRGRLKPLDEMHLRHAIIAFRIKAGYFKTSSSGAINGSRSLPETTAQKALLPPVPRSRSHRDSPATLAVKSSSFHDDVSRFLLDRGFRHENEFREPRTDFICDIFIPQKNLILEADGVQHYLGPDYALLNGCTALKYKLLRGLGYRVVDISMMQWQRLGRDPVAKRELLTRLVEEGLS